MAQPPPKKLDPQVADRINTERKKGWNNGEGLFLVSNLKRIGQHWRAKARAK
ncbi:hypothetical protein K505DRAFT_364724 [Melanomma pulvis-pyrius CBS 109.77]|uniref:HTH myb-type domain-containing protein n=1 Tax=Melanomma pulvis-pyrius CBS 109.77 TaxID=1314802 RepID=A0A6A6X2L3_9PLEO|nr:hypothetical protein K505DRAFT_364724 [Melanomma pulvis-pyrius CBS 109.77]